MGWLQDALGRFTGRADPATTQVDWRERGNAALAGGDLPGAARYYAQGVAAYPGDPTLRMNHGYVLLELGQPAAAAERLEQALALRRPDDAFVHDGHFLLGRAYAQLQRPQEALAQFAAAARAKTDFAEPLEEAVRLLDHLQHHAEAAQWAQRLVGARPSPGSELLLAVQWANAGRPGDALVILDRLCAREGGNVEAGVRRFEALLASGRFADALAEAERVLALTGPHAGALANVAAALEKLGRPEEALRRLDDALRLEPFHAGVQATRVALLTQQLRLDDAIAAARQGLASFPEDADLHWNLALAHLLRGDFEQGWRGHEWRLRVAGLQHKALQVDAPAWHGEALAGRTILLHGEQGFGDNIQFVRLVPRVAAAAGAVVLRIPPALHPLLRDHLPPNVRLLAAQAPLPAVDCHASLMSLPAILQLTPAEFSPQTPYLHADPTAVAAWGARTAGNGLRVGVAWCGNPAHANDHNRSLALATFRAVAAEECRFFTVQPHLPEADREALRAWHALADVGRELRDFADTAALIEALDVVVTVDTAVAHVAGALGKPVWILLPYSPDWRWMCDRPDSPWYPSARLYRQPAPGDWAAVLAQVNRDLRAMARTG
jgi:tetratricopeptide (TPR) repeat protein